WVPWIVCDQSRVAPLGRLCQGTAGRTRETRHHLSRGNLMFRSLHRPLAYLVLGLSACAVLPLTGVVSAKQPGSNRFRGQMLPYVPPGAWIPPGWVGNLAQLGATGAVGNAGNTGAAGNLGVTGLGGISGAGIGGTAGIGGSISGIGGIGGIG